MLDGSNNIRRTKSTTSVKDRRKHPIPAEPLDPHTSHIHAMIAAHRAVDRSHQRSSVELRRANSSANQRTTRPQAIRFITSDQIRGQRSLIHLPQAPTPAISITDQYQHVRPHPTELDTTESYGAEPSSYRRIRRARSMITPRRSMAHRLDSPEHTPFSQARTLRSAASSAVLTEPGLRLRLKRSLTILRPTTRTPIPPRSQTEMGHRNEAIELAREQWNDQQNREFHRRPSMLFHPKMKRQQKAFRKSLRTAVQIQADEPTTLDAQVFIPSPSGPSRRSFSASIRSGVRRVFGKPANHRTSALSQQLEAQQSYYQESIDPESQTDKFDEYHVDLEDPETRNSLYIPSTPEDDALEELDEFPTILHSTASRESLHSNTKSRVTSWTNSTTSASTAHRSTTLGPNRLSIIKEDGGPHQPSSSAGRHLGGLSTLDQSKQHSPPKDAPSNIDGQRIYSALMRRIGKEEQELSETQAELEKIHHYQDQNAISDRPTIRAVSNDTALSVATNTYRLFGLNEELDRNGEDSVATRKIKYDRHKERLVALESQSSFFPHSSRMKPETPSPFRMMLTERKSRETSEEPSEHSRTGLSSIIHHRRRGSDGIARARIGMSTDSVYSRLSNGDSNPDYVDPIASSESIAIHSGNVVGFTGMATILPATHSHHSLSRPRLRPQDTASSAEKAEWKGWMEGQLSSLQRNSSKRTSHFREETQIDSDDIEVNDNVMASKVLNIPVDIRPRSRAFIARRMNRAEFTPSRSSSQSPFMELREISKNSTPIPQPNSQTARSYSALLKKASNMTLGYSRHNDENNATSSGLRKISPSNIARLIKEKKSQAFTQNLSDLNKENRSRSASDSPPFSTPGRLQLRMRNADGTGRLRKRASDMRLSNSKDEKLTPLSAKDQHENRTTPSPGDSIKKLLKARLSRPFDMDVPQHNRPFDSIYLGKKDDAGDNGHLGRLSVAPRALVQRSNGYGGLGASPFGSEDNQVERMDGDDTKQHNSQRNGSSWWTSKRMVSNFLRNRRNARSGSGSRQSSRGLSPAFI